MEEKSSIKINNKELYHIIELEEAGLYNEASEAMDKAIEMTIQNGDNQIKLIEFLEYALKTSFIENTERHLSREELKKHSDLCKKAVGLIDDNLLFEKKQMPGIVKVLILKEKYGDKFLYSINSDLNELKTLEDQVLSQINLAQVMIIEIKDKHLIIEGYHNVGVINNQNELVIVDDKGNVYKSESNKDWPIRDRYSFDGNLVCRGNTFKFDIPCDTVNDIRFAIKEGNYYKQINISFGNFSKIDKFKGSFYKKDNYVIEYVNKRIVINKKIGVIDRRIRLFLSLVKKKRFDIICTRLAFHVFNLWKKKPLWICRDNETRAKDSAIEFFKYCSKRTDRSKRNTYFIIDKNCDDYNIVKEYGKTIQPYSFMYKIRILQSDVFVDTRGSFSPEYVFGKDKLYYKDLCNWSYIWLIHGVMTRNESTWTNKFLINAKLYATCGEREREAILDEKNGYGYDCNEVKITGLPRHDALVKNQQKKILFLPTWRKEFAGDLIPGTSERKYVENFRECLFCRFYDELINDERLLNCLKENGYTGDFYLHPSFIKQASDFRENEIIKVGKKPADTNKLISESSLVITDYSSAAFEAAFLDIPVVYTQYDIDTFGERHTGKDGYFDYYKDGFGSVVIEYDDAVKEIIRIVENGCKNEEIYRKRANQFFVYRDNKNSERVYKAIEEII